jgi:hypothetical protein
MTVYLPLSGQISRWSGAGLGNDGRTLSNQATTGPNSVSSYVRHGIDSPQDSSYWTNNTVIGGGTETSWFYSTLEQISITPTGTIEFKIRGNVALFNDFTIANSVLWLRKDVNPSIANDIIVASGIGSVTFFESTPTNKTINMQIVEANRAAFESGIPFYPTISGQINWGIFAATSGDYHISEININASGTVAPTLSTSSNFDLYIGGHLPSSGDVHLYTVNIGNSSGNFDLYIQGSVPSSGSVDLYIAGPIPQSGDFPLYIGGMSSGDSNFTLYTHGAMFINSGIDLYIPSYARDSGVMNLFLKGRIGVPANEQFPLFTYATTNSGLYKSFDLVLYQNSQFDPRNSMNLVLTGPTAIATTSNMNLFLENTRDEVSSGIPLFVGNYWSENSGNITLFMSAPSGTEGAVPFSGSMNLYMARDFDSIALSVPLFLKSIDYSSGTAPLYIFGANIANSSIPLYVTGKDSSQIKTSTLYTSGF